MSSHIIIQEFAFIMIKESQLVLHLECYFPEYLEAIGHAKSFECFLGYEQVHHPQICQLGFFIYH